MYTKHAQFYNTILVIIKSNSVWSGDNVVQWTLKHLVSGVKGEYSLHGATSLPHYKEWAMKTPLLKYYSVHSKSTAVLVERVWRHQSI